MEDAELAARVRPLVHDGAGDRSVEEKRMFGGLAFLVDGKLAVAVGAAGDLLLKPEPAAISALLELEHVEPMQMGTRTSRTWLNVAAPALADDAELEAWVVRGIAGGAPAVSPTLPT